MEPSFVNIRNNFSKYTNSLLSEKISNQVAECTRLILV
jgi:hypothetical protein